MPTLVGYVCLLFATPDLTWVFFTSSHVVHDLLGFFFEDLMIMVRVLTTLLCTFFGHFGGILGHFCLGDTGEDIKCANILK